MDYLNTEDLDCIAYIDKKTNNVVIRFVGLPNAIAAELFTDYVMMTLGVDYNPLDNRERSKMVH
jgi:predicted metallopeptidase